MCFNSEVLDVLFIMSWIVPKHDWCSLRLHKGSSTTTHPYQSVSLPFDFAVCLIKEAVYFPSLLTLSLVVTSLDHGILLTGQKNKSSEACKNEASFLVSLLLPSVIHILLSSCRRKMSDTKQAQARSANLLLRPAICLTEFVTSRLEIHSTETIGVKLVLQ